MAETIDNSEYSLISGLRKGKNGGIANINEEVREGKSIGEIKTINSIWDY